MCGNKASERGVRAVHVISAGRPTNDRRPQHRRINRSNRIFRICAPLHCHLRTRFVVFRVSGEFVACFRAPSPALLSSFALARNRLATPRRHGLSSVGRAGSAAAGAGAGAATKHTSNLNKIHDLLQLQRDCSPFSPAGRFACSASPSFAMRSNREHIFLISRQRLHRLSVWRVRATQTRGRSARSRGILSLKFIDGYSVLLLVRPRQRSEKV